MGIFDFLKKNKNIDNENGLNEVYSDNGKGVLEERFYKKNGEIDGLSQHYNKNGDLIEESNYVKGKKNGSSKVYFFGDRPRKYQSILDEIKEHTGLDVSNMEENELFEAAKNLGIEVNKTMGTSKLIDKIFGEKCEHLYIQIHQVGPPSSKGNSSLLIDSQLMEYKNDLLINKIGYNKGNKRCQYPVNDKNEFEWWDNGNLKKEITYKDCFNKPDHYLRKDYDKNGQLESEINFINNKYDEEKICKYYYENGQLKEEGKHKSVHVVTNERSARYIHENQNETGSIRFKEYDLLTKNGLWKSYYENGQIKCHYKFVYTSNWDDFEIVYEKEWDENGKIKEREIQAKMDDNTVVESFYDKFYGLSSSELIDSLNKEINQCEQQDDDGVVSLIKRTENNSFGHNGTVITYFICGIWMDSVTDYMSLYDLGEDSLLFEFSIDENGKIISDDSGLDFEDQEDEIYVYGQFKNLLQKDVNKYGNELIEILNNSEWFQKNYGAKNAYESFLEQFNSIKKNSDFETKITDKELSTKPNYVDGLKQGEFKSYYDSGELETTVNYVDGLKQGEDNWYYKSGELESTVTYVDNLRQGEEKEYYESGGLESTVNYVDNLKQGEFKSYYESGGLQYTRNYVDGKLQGELKTYYESGELKSTTNYVDDLAQGELKTYYESGELESTENYVDDLRQGELKTYYESGELKSTTNYVGGFKQ